MSKKRRKLTEETMGAYIEWLEHLLAKIYDAQHENPDRGTASYLERKKLLALALKEHWPLAKLEQKLTEKRLKTLFLRNPFEVILWFCLAQNQTGNLYGVEEFRNLADALVKEQKEETTTIKFTLAGIKKFLHETAEPSEEFFLETAKITTMIRTEFETINFGSENAEECFVRLFKKNRELLRRYSQAIEYYLNYYVFYLVSHEVLEFIEILKKISSLDVRESVQWLRNRTVDGTVHGQWSLMEQYWNDEKMMRTLERYAAACNDGVLAKNKAAEVRQMDKFLLGDLQQKFVLGGSPSEPKENSLLLCGTLSKTIGEQTLIFEGDSEKHKRLKEEIQALTLSDFQYYAIDLNKLYHLLFEVPRGVEASEKGGKDKRTFLRNLLSGNADISRSAMLLCLLSMRGALFNRVYLESAERFLGDEFVRLNVDRIDSILHRLGYPPLGIGILDHEKFYYEVFEKKLFPMEILDAFNQDFHELSGENDLLPYEVRELECKKDREWQEEFVSKKKVR